MATQYKYSGTFEITEPSTLTVTSPSSSTILYVGDTHNITWSTTGSVDNVKIELYDGNNSKTATISAVTGNDGNFTWTVRGSQLSGSDDEYQIKIFELDGDPVDYSSNFRIWDYNPKTITEGIDVSETITAVPSTWKVIKTATDGISLGETIPVPDTRTWRTDKTSSDGIDLTEAIESWKDLFNSATEGLTVSETITPVPGTWKHVKTATEGLTVSETIPYPVPFTFRTDKTPTEGLTVSETIPTPETRTWKYIKTATDDLTVSEIIPVPDTRTWRHLKTPLEGLTVTETIPYPDTRTWRHFKTTDEDLTVTETILTATRTWHRKVSEVLSITEGIAETLGVNPDDGIAFIESVIPAIFHSCKIRKFQSVPTESYGTIHKTGWFTVSDSLTRTNILRRLNVEYNSADPLNVKIYVDGDDENPVFTHTLAAATDNETTNKSVRISRRAKSFMLELGTAASTNTNVTVEDIEVEVDDA